MKIVDFPGTNIVFAENQPEYLRLPAHKSENGKVTCCWQPTLRERLRILFNGRIWLTTLTFNQPLQPLLLEADMPDFSNADGP